MATEAKAWSLSGNRLSEFAGTESPRVKRDSAYAQMKGRIAAYANTGAAAEYFSAKYERIREAFETPLVRNYLFAPVAGLLSSQPTMTAGEIRSTITRVAVANAVLAGLPGKLGVGVFVSIALEAYMAYRIARHSGVRIDKPADVWKYFGVVSGVLATIFWGFRQILGVAFSAFSIIPGVSPMIPAEFVTTCLVGVVFWVGFEEAATSGSFSVPKRAWKSLTTRTKDLVGSQWATIRATFTPANISLMANRLRTWLSGDIVSDGREARSLRGDAAVAVMLAALLSGRTDELRGPLGEVFMRSIRDRLPDLADATDVEIADFLRGYEPEQISGLVSLIKGKMFEHLVAIHENADGDQWVASLFENESHPGSDIVFSDPATGDFVEVSLKATDDPLLIEHALLRYPDFDVMTTGEVAAHFADDPRVIPTEFSNQTIADITSANLDEMLEHVDLVSSTDVAEAMAAATGASAAVKLWPFGVAYLRGRLTRDEFERACVQIVPSSGRALAMRVIFGMAIGPIYGWYALARMTMKIVPDEPVGRAPRGRRLVALRKDS